MSHRRRSEPRGSADIDPLRAAGAMKGGEQQARTWVIVAPGTTRG